MSPPDALYESAYPDLFSGGFESTGIDAYETAVPGLAEDIHGSSSPEPPWNLHEFDVTLQQEYQPLKSLYTHPSFTATSISAGCTMPFDYFNTQRCDEPKGFDLSSPEVLGSSAFHYDDGTGSTASSLLQPNSRTVHPSQPDYLTMELGNLSIDKDLPATTGAFGVNSLQSGSRKSSVPTRQWANDRDGIFDPFNYLQESISLGTNNSLISSSLLRIYYNSFENALSCWVTESNCPYRKLKREECELLHQPPTQTAEVRHHLSIYARVCRLDETFAPLHGQLVTKSDSHKASKSIYAAILAFASQWSYARHKYLLRQFK
ncbi:hypothetical protein AbraIFM66950_005173 [Aspergillus brasiliensis]|nr:hypothetical protein AbraIFM66950_005173 [Aspergillus brasiliensis]